MLSNYEQAYCQLVADTIRDGVAKESRAGNVYSTFGRVLVIDELVKGMFPLLHGRKMFYKNVFGEMAAFLRGPKHVEDFKGFGCNYWDSWAEEDGSISVDYGNIWRNFEGVDQLRALINMLRHNPNDRRMIITGWNPANLERLSLPCCHMLYQWWHNPSTNTLEMIWYQRSVDVMVGLPSDVILAAVFNILLANEVGMRPGRITMFLADTHVYENHLDPTRQYLDNAMRCMRDNSIAPGTPYILDKGTSIDTFMPGDIQVLGYVPFDPIKFELNV